MRKILSLLAILAGLAQAQTVIPLTVSYDMLTGRAGNYAPPSYAMLCYDDTTRGGYSYAYYQASGEGYNQTIYSNSVFKVEVDPSDSTALITQIALHQTQNQNSGSPYATRKTANYYDTITPFDRHPYYTCHGGALHLLDGLHASGNIRDTLTFTDAEVNATTDEVTVSSVPSLTPWITKDVVRFSSSGSLPGNISAGTDYHLIRTSATTFKIATSAANAGAGTSRDITSAGSGTHTMIRSLSIGWHPSDVWDLNLSTGAYTQHHLTASTSWFRGYTGADFSAVVWHRYYNKVFRHPGWNFESNVRASWTYDPATNTAAHLDSRGTIGLATAPVIWSAQSMVYDDTLKRVWFFGDQDTVHTGTFEGAGNSLWYIDTTGNWVETSPESTRPVMRQRHAVIPIPGSPWRFLVAGGRSSTGTRLRDIWTYTPSASAGSRWDSIPALLPSSTSDFTYGYFDGYRGGAVFQQSTGNDWSFLEIGDAYLVDNVAPVITDDPDNATENEGETATFTCAATGTPTPTWTWEKDGVTIGGATSSSYTTPTLTAADNGAAFTCIATNSEGSDESAPAVLTVLTPATVTDDPDDVTVTEPDPAEFECAAAGSPVISYQWQRNGSDIPGETNPWYILDPTELADDGDLFRCIVSNAAGADTSTAAELTVESALSAPVVTVNPAHDTVLAPAAGEFSCTATGNPTPTYQWQRDGVDIGGATSSTYTTPATVYGDDGAAFRCIVTNSEGADTSTAGILTVNAAPVITSDPQDRTVLVGASAGFGVGVTGSPTLTYQWQEDGSDIVGATSATYTIPSAAEADSGKAFRVIVTNSFGADTSGAAILHVVDEIRRAKVGPRRKAGIGPR